MQPKTKPYSTNKLILPFLFVVYSLFFELTNFLYLGFTNENGGRMFLPTYFLFDLTIICMLAAVIFLVQGKKIMNIVFYLFLIIQFVLNIVNTTMYSIFGDILSWDLLKLGAEATTAITMDFIDWGGVFLNIGLMAVMVAGTIFIQKYNKSTFQIKHFSLPVLVLAIFIFSQSMNVCFFQIQSALLTTPVSAEREIETSDEYLWENFQFKIEAYKKFGHFGFYTKSIVDLILKSQPSEDELAWYSRYIDEGHVDGDKKAPLYNDNLIVVLCESLDTFAIDPINTPTLWKMSQGYNTVVFENFRARNRTNISEGATLIGSMPKSFYILDAYNAGYEFDYSLPKVFKDAGDENVVTTYVHSNIWSFYDRDITHTENAIGFDEKYTIEDYDGEQKFENFGSWINELSFTQNLIDKIMPTDTRFLTYFTTVATHGPYTDDNKYFDKYYQTYDQNFEEFAKWQEENTNFVMPTNESDLQIYRRYKSQVIDFDRTVEYLLTQLENRGLNENTSILFFADHNTYYHDLTYKIKGIEKSDFSNTEVNHIPMMLYSEKLTDENGVKIDAFCNTYDILPTLCDLYGMESNRNLYLGYSIFSSDIKNSLFASHLGGIFTDNIYSQNISKVYILEEGVSEENVENFKENANKFYRKQEYAEVIYKYGINGTIR